MNRKLINEFDKRFLTIKDAKEAEKVGNMMLKLLKEEELDGFSLVGRTCYDVFQFTCAFPEIYDYENWIQRAYHSFLYSRGPDEITTIELKKLVDNPKSHYQYNTHHAPGCLIM